MFALVRHTVRKRMMAKLRAIVMELRRCRHEATPAQGRWLSAVLRGHHNYYAVPTNIQALGTFLYALTLRWYRSLRRRSQRSRLNWKRMDALATRWLPQPPTKSRSYRDRNTHQNDNTLLRYGIPRRSTLRWNMSPWLTELPEQMAGAGGLEFARSMETGSSLTSREPCWCRGLQSAKQINSPSYSSEGRAVAVGPVFHRGQLPP